MRSIREEDGSALIEFALIMTVMTTMLLGLVDYGVLIMRKMQLQQAAIGAAEYGAMPGNESNLANIQSAGTQLAYYISGVSATATNVWMCTPGGSSVSSTTLCSGGVTPYKYVVVTTSANLPRAVVFPGLATSTTLTGYATVRVPWTK